MIFINFASQTNREMCVGGRLGEREECSLPLQHCQQRYFLRNEANLLKRASHLSVKLRVRARMKGRATGLPTCCSYKLFVVLPTCANWGRQVNYYMLCGSQNNHKCAEGTSMFAEYFHMQHRWFFSSIEGFCQCSLI